MLILALTLALNAAPVRFAEAKISCFAEQHAGARYVARGAEFVRFVTGDGLKCEGYVDDGSWCCRSEAGRSFTFFHPGVGQEFATCAAFRRHEVPTCYFTW